MNEQEKKLNAEPNTGDINGVKYIYDSYFKESENISHRTDWFLLFHAILFEAFFSTIEPWGFKNNGLQLPFNGVQLIINLLGFVISAYWFMTGIRTWKILWEFGGFMRDESIVGRDLSGMHHRIYSQRKKRTFYSWSKPSIVFLIIIPLLFIISWAVICILYFDFSLIRGYVLIALLLIIIITVVVYYADNKMKNKYGVNDALMSLLF